MAGYSQWDGSEGMKLRIKGDSLRLRVSRSELAMLLTGKCLEETVHFTPEAGAKLTYALQQDPTLTSPMVQYTENRVAVLLPAGQVKVWGTTEQVGIAQEINLGDLGSLALLIEKDFACLDRSDQDDPDAFENPNAGPKC
jgi:hypothetical protein